MSDELLDQAAKAIEKARARRAELRERIEAARRAGAKVVMSSQELARIRAPLAPRPEDQGANAT